MTMRYYLPRGLTYNLIDPAYPPAALDGLKSALSGAISAEADWAVGQAAGPIIRWFEYSHGAVGAGKAWALEQLTALVPGRPSPFFEALDNAIQDGATLVRGTGGPTSLAYVEGEIDAEWQQPARMVLVVLAGGDATGVPVFFEIADPDAEVPEGLPERTYLEDEVETAHSWRIWGTSGDSHVPVELGGKWYRSSAVGASGEPLAASQWVGLYFAGVPILSVDEFRAIQTANVPEI